MNKILKGFLIALGGIAAFALLCVGLYSIGYLDLFVIFVVPGVLIVGSVSCLIWNIVKAVDMKKRGEPVPKTTKVMIVVCSVILGTVLLAIATLIAVFAMAIAFM